MTRTAQLAKVRSIFAAAWLPVYLLFSVGWLWGPALLHQHYGSLQLISGLEAHRQLASSLFRLSDVLAATLVLSAALIFRLWQQARWFGAMLIGIAALLAIDGLFPDTCYIGHASCSLLAARVSLVHDIETVLLGGCIALLSAVDAIKRRRLASIGFVGVQLAAGFLALTHIGSAQFIAVLQYVYETALMFWLGWLIDNYNPEPYSGHERPLRRLIGAWVVAGGVFAIAVPFLHDRVQYHWHGLGMEWLGVALEQHGIVAGIALLYLARHIIRGERPALWLALILMYSQLIKYSVLTPHLVGVTVYVILVVALLSARRGFTRNTEPPSWATRGTEVAIIFGGVTAAILVIVAGLIVSGHWEHFLTSAQHMYDRRRHYTLSPQEQRLVERFEDRLRTMFTTLMISLGAVTLWSLFRPRGLGGSGEVHDRQRMLTLLQRYSTNSEDYFKLWPTESKRYFFVPGIEGAIAYRVEGGTAFMLADPIAGSVEDRRALLKAFLGFTRRHGLTACVFIIGGVSPDMYKAAGLQVRQIGSSAVISIAAFNETTRRNKWWRWQQNRAKRNGWQYQQYTAPHSWQLMQELAGVSHAWLGHRGRTEQGFALGYFDEAYLQRCTIHTLRDADGRLVAFTNQLPAFGKTTQAGVDLIRYLPELDGAMPSLLAAVIEVLAEGPYQTFDLGFVPLAKLDTDLARLLRALGRNRFSARGLEQFKNKFEPDWHPDYLAYDGDLLDLARSATRLERLFRVAEK